MKNKLTITNLRAAIDGKEILKGISLTVGPGEVHAIMGPNGSGKSTLAYALLAGPNYVTKGNIAIGKKSLTKLSSEDRAKAGLFLAFQTPIAIPGVSVVNLLRTAVGNTQKITKNPGLLVPIGDFMKKIREYAKFLHIEETFLTRGIHDGFSGGEKKKIEMLQALMLSPKFAVFDEIDTGLDVDALRLVASGIERLAKTGTGVIVITHYQRILKFVKPDVIHVLMSGKIVKTGKAALAKQIEDHGYTQFSL